jgi:hypothetical protein
VLLVRRRLPTARGAGARGWREGEGRKEVQRAYAALVLLVLVRVVVLVVVFVVDDADVGAARGRVPRALRARGRGDLVAVVGRRGVRHASAASHARSQSTRAHVESRERPSAASASSSPRAHSPNLRAPHRLGDRDARPRPGARFSFPGKRGLPDPAPAAEEPGAAAAGEGAGRNRLYAGRTCFGVLGPVRVRVRSPALG